MQPAGISSNLAYTPLEFLMYFQKAIVYNIIGVGTYLHLSDMLQPSHFLATNIFYFAAICICKSA